MNQFEATSFSLHCRPSLFQLKLQLTFWGVVSFVVIISELPLVASLYALSLLFVQIKLHRKTNQLQLMIENSGRMKFRMLPSDEVVNFDVDLSNEAWQSSQIKHVMSMVDHVAILIETQQDKIWVVKDMVLEKDYRALIRFLNSHKIGQ